MTAGDACARCGAGLDSRQDYCLECGLRRLPRRRRVHWLWPVAAAALVAAGGAAAAIAVGADEGESATIVALSPLRPIHGSSPQRREKLLRWPARDGYTVVLAVVPRTAGADSARAKALAAVSAGLLSVGVLDSSRFSSLHPGYWVVFSGVYRSLDEAISHLPRAARHVRTAYAQQITR